MINSNGSVFIAHSTSESVLARRLSRALAHRGIRVAGPEKMSLTAEVARQLEEALRGAECYIVLVSEEALVSPDVNFEIGAALGGDKKLLPVYLSKRARRKAHPPLKRFRGIMAEGLAANEIADKIARLMEKRAA